jgi:hypothetical protein
MLAALAIGFMLAIWVVVIYGAAYFNQNVHWACAFRNAANSRLKSTDGLLAKQARGEHSAGQSKKAPGLAGPGLIIPDQTICKPTRSEMVNARRSARWIGNTLPRARRSRTAPDRKKRPQLGCVGP